MGASTTALEVHPHWCLREQDCYGLSDPIDVEHDTAWHRRTYSTDNGIEGFIVEQTGTRTPEIITTWSALSVEDLLAAAQVLLQIYRDLADVHPKEFTPEVALSVEGDKGQ